MGMTVARKIIEAGHSLTAYDTSSEALDRIRQIGATAVLSPKEVAEKADVIIMFLPGPEQVCACVIEDDGLLAGARPGTVIADMSTVDPDTSRRMAQLADKREVGYLDAPVLGRPASVGNWALAVGGTKESLERCEPIFMLFAAKVFLIGESGSGNKVKLLNQLMFSAINAMTAEMMAVAEKTGISPKLLYETITESQAGTVSNLFKELGARIANDDYESPTFSVDLLCKDVRLAISMAKEAKAPPLLATTTQIINETAQAQGLGQRDTSFMLTVFKKLWQE